MIWINFGAPSVNPSPPTSPEFGLMSPPAMRSNVDLPRAAENAENFPFS